ncbi:protein phosphatase 1 regulatory subunit 37-like protein [Lates japonicus]|uniref:Protein phosphatase 1 regulatory subunit 37-like protein n=1 Tax=Lates japonicus TaxID=270547 RepID=A0AAD3NPW5_LATJO|nr:protein phosphatase 1 regulatory subunit 37-like protein [Lates japonicus]
MVDYPALSLCKALLTSRLTVLHLHNAQLSGHATVHTSWCTEDEPGLQELHLTNNLLNSYHDALRLGDLLHYNTTLGFWSSATML